MSTMRKQVSVESGVYEELQRIKRNLEYKDNVDLSLSDTIYELIVKYKELMDQGKAKKKGK